MDILIAIVVVAGIGAAALAVAAYLTAPSRINVQSAFAATDRAEPGQATGTLPETARQFRVFGWVFVLLLYFLAVFCVLQGLNDMRVVHYWALWEAAFGSALSSAAEITLYSRFWIAMAVTLVLIGFWAQRRLRRRLP